MRNPSSILIVSALIGAAGGWLYDALHNAPPAPQMDYDLSALAGAYELAAQATNAAWEKGETEPTLLGWMQPAVQYTHPGYPWRRLRRILMAVWFDGSTRVAPAPTEKGDESIVLPRARLLSPRD